MALWTGLGQAATVAQLVGADVGGLISMIMQAALTARQNRRECEQLARRVLMIAQLLPHVQDPEAAQQLAGLGDTLQDAHELVVSCQGRSAAYQFVMAGRQAKRFREVQSKIDFYLILFPVISHIGITRRLERIYNILAQDDPTRAEPSQLAQSSQPQEVVPHGSQEFTCAEILAATNNFSPDTMIGEGGFGTVYRGRLHDGREVAVKRMIKTMQWSDLQEEILSRNLHEEFSTELDNLSRLRHKHIVRLLGSCVTTVSKDDKRMQAVTLKKRKLQALKRVAWTARCCVKLDPKDRMAISDVVANLEMAQELISRDGPASSVDEPGLVDEFPLPDSPGSSSSVSSEDYRYQSDMESEVLEEGR